MPTCNAKVTKNYLTSYLGKSWTDTGSKYKKQSWTKEQFVYNMEAWKNQIRFWGCSRDLSKVVAWTAPQNLDEILKYNPKVCYKTELRDTFYDEPIGNIWKADEKLISEVKRNFYKWYAKVEDILYGMKRAAG